MMIATEPMETIHLYYEQDEEPTPPTGGFDLWIILFCLVCFALLVWRVCSIPPTLETVIVPAHFLPVKYFAVPETIVPTGVKTYPATTAHGIVTITNGSILSGELPQGIILTGKDGVEVVTDTAVFVPAGSAAGYGLATVSAHAMIRGKNGNIPAYDIDSVVNTSIYIRNLTAFTGGKQGYSITYTTMQDRQKALERARAIVSRLVPQMLLDAPCTESVRNNRLTWTCQYITYTPPVFFTVVGIEIKGKNLLLIGYFVAQPRRVFR
jgi:hypothetical protein